jgi:hypothetical protein
MKKISDLEKARDLLRKIEQSSRVPRKLRYEIGKFLRGDRDFDPIKKEEVINRIYQLVKEHNDQLLRDYKE